MHSLARTIVVIALLSVVQAVIADGIEFRRVALTLGDDDTILLDAESSFDLSDTVAEALENGVPLTFETHVQMRRADSWVWESDVVDRRLRTLLQYRPLSGLYELRDLQGKGRLSFATRDAALRTLGRIVGMPVVTRDKLDLDQDYLVRLRLRLDIEALPLPMRPAAYLKREWRLASDVWEWRLRP